MQRDDVPTGKPQSVIGSWMQNFVVIFTGHTVWRRFGRGTTLYERVPAPIDATCAGCYDYVRSDDNGIVDKIGATAVHLECIDDYYRGGE